MLPVHPTDDSGDGLAGDVELPGNDPVGMAEGGQVAYFSDLYGSQLRTPVALAADFRSVNTSVCHILPVSSPGQVFRPVVCPDPVQVASLLSGRPWSYESE